MNEQTPRQTIYIGILIAVTALWTFVYALPRLSQVHTLEQESQGYARQRQEIANALAAYQRSRSDLPAPDPNTVSWLAANALTGLEKNLDSNNPYKDGKGSELKLRNIDGEQVAALFEKLNKVNLIITSLKMEDADGNGRWNVEMMVEVPQ